MLKIGQYNMLRVNRFVDFGAYLDGGDGIEILLPLKYFDETLSVGDEINVFVYTDSSDRLIATTEQPFAKVGEFAYLQVTQVNNIGAFLDWGISGKDLLVPFREQKEKMREGGIYLVYVFLDDTTKRVVASEKIEKFLGNVVADYKKGDTVDALIYQHTPLGYKCIVDNLHYGMIYSNEVYQPLELENTVRAYVKQVRDDGKIDLSIADTAKVRTSDLATEIYHELQNSKTKSLPFSDKSDPEEIKQHFHCSKKDFKKAIGKLYKEHKIKIEDNKISL